MLTGLFGSCSDMLNIDSDRVVLVDENKLNSANDSLYSIAGILNLWQAYGEQYVLLGELRGDLMDVTDNTSIELREIANFTATADNPYVSRRAAYAVIQNCNYVIKNLDTTVVVNSQRLMKREYAVAKVYRAWMYLQLGLNYGKAVYITEPILSLEAAEKDYPEYDLPQLIDALIADLAPVEEIELTMGFPTYGRIGSRNLQDSFIPVDMLLGDLYLWKASLTGDRSAYEMAAQKYYSLMNLQQYGYTVPRYSTEWGNTLYTSLIMYNSGWNGIFSGSNNEVITAMTCAAKYGLLYKTLPNLATQPKYTYEVAPSQVAMQNWKNQVYYLETNRNDTIPGVYNTIDGDFRGYVSWGMNTISSSYRQYEINPGDTIPLIYKYSLSQSTISGSVGDDGEETDDEEAEEELNLIYYDVFLYRVATLYLHYAEALNNLTTSYTIEVNGQSRTYSRNEAAILAAFNQVRYRAGLPGLTTLPSRDEFQKLLERERMVEFMHENHRYFDVRRWGIYEETEHEPMRGMNVEASSGNKEAFYRRTLMTGNIRGRVVDRKLMFVPIPRDEMRRLPSLDQNPGW